MAGQLDPLALDSQLCFAIYSTLNAIGKTYAPLLERLGLTYPQYLVMLVLWKTDDLTVKTLGERLFLDSGTLTPLLKRLEAAGLVNRDRDPTDERQVRITLTRAGRVLREKALDVPQDVACAMGGDLQSLQALREDLLQLRGRLRAHLRHGGDS